MSVAFNTDVTVTVEAAFGDDPLDDPRTWTDISAYVRSFETRRGRSAQSDRVTNGSASILLDNMDGRFDPTYTTGAYYGNLKPMVPVRITADYDVTDCLNLGDATDGYLGRKLQVGDVPLFTGFADGFPQAYPSTGKDSTVSLTLTDGFKPLNLLQVDGTFGLETAGGRIRSLLLGAGIPAGWLSVPRTGELCQLATYTKSPLLRAIRQAEDTDGGLFFVRADGQMDWHDQAYRGTLSSVATFTDDGTGLPYADIVIGHDERNLYNQVTVTRRGGTAQTYSDATSIGDYMQRDLSLNDTLHTSDALALTMATATVGVFKTPSITVDQLDVLPQNSPTSLWPAVLGSDLSAKFTVERASSSGDTISQDVFLEGVRHRASAVTGQWQSVLTFSPFER